MSRISRPKVLDLQFPVAGLHRRLAYRQQSPFTTPDAKNVRPDGVLLGRRRGGSRPGNINYVRTSLDGFPIRMLSSVRFEDTSGLTVWNDDMLGSGNLATSNRWGPKTGVTKGPDLSGGLASSEAGDGEESVMLATGVSSLIKATADREIAIFIVPFEGRHYGQYSLFARSVTAQPGADGVVATMDWGTSLGGTVNDGIVQTQLTIFKGSAAVHTVSAVSSDAGFEAGGWFTLKITAADVASIFFNDLTGASYDFASHSLPAGERCGFGITPDALPITGKNRVDRFRLMYHNTDTSPNKSRDMLMASADNELWKESMPGSFVEVANYPTGHTSANALSSSNKIQAVDYQGKLYIADYEDPIVIATDIAIGSYDQLTSSMLGNPTTAGVDVDKHIVHITDSGTTVPANTDITGTYEITARDSSVVEISPEMPASSASNVTGHIVRYAKKYDPKTDTLSIWKAASIDAEDTPSKGGMPGGFRTIARWRDRIVVGGGRSQPHLWFMSKRGDPEDWNIASSLVGRAVAGTSSDAGQLGEPLISLIPHTDDCLLFMSKTSCWVMRGDPTMGGQLDKLSDVIGIVDVEAYAYTAEEDLVFLSHDGVYSIPAGCGQPPISLSRELMPEELRGLDADTHDTSMVYDVRYRGIHIFVSRKLDAATSGTPTASHFWFDMETKSFWPMAFAVANHEPIVAYEYTSLDTPSSGIVMGCRDGYMRTFNRYADQDDGGNAIVSHVYYGPIRMGPPMMEGLLQSLQCVLAENGGDVDCDIYVGNSHEAAFNSSSFAQDTWATAGLNRMFRPRARGVSFLIKLSSNIESEIPWAIESIEAKIRAAGVRRVF